VKRISVLSSALLLVGAAAFGQGLTQADRERGVQYLDQIRDGVVAATAGLSDAQLKFRAAPDRWSVAETLEHIAKSEEFLFRNVTDKVVKAPAGPAGRDTAKTDAAILATIPDRTHKVKAPAALVPTSTWTPAESLDHFLQNHAKMTAFLESTPDLREHVADSPFGQPWDAYEWVLFIAAHSERHTKQILEVKADPNFPKM
jgi:hypothetical protein